MHVYREKELQLAAVRWMADNWGYKELAADQEATGDRMDTIGLLGRQLIAIEVKPEVDRGLVWHDEALSGLLEPKISATLRGLYRGETGGQFGIMRDHWDRAGPPLIGILAGEYNSIGLFELAQCSGLALRHCFSTIGSFGGPGGGQGNWVSWRRAGPA